MRVPSKEITQRLVHGFRDSDPRSQADAAGLKAIVANPQAAGGRGKVAAIVAGASDAESLRQAARATGKLQKVFGAMQGDPSSASHLLDALQRFQSAEENAASFAFRLAGNVEAVVISVDEVDVGMTRRAEQNGVALRAT